MKDSLNKDGHDAMIHSLIRSVDNNDHAWRNAVRLLRSFEVIVMAAIECGNKRAYIALRHQIQPYAKAYPIAAKKLQKCRSRKAVLKVANELREVLRADMQIKKEQSNITRATLETRRKYTVSNKSTVKQAVAILVMVSALAAWALWGIE